MHFWSMSAREMHFWSVSAPLLPEVISARLSGQGSCIYEGSTGKSCLKTVRSWTPVSPKVIGDFSAICYLTARDVSRLHTGARPIGLIESDWGVSKAGTQLCKERAL